MKVVALYSIKGGVGKTTAAVNLGYEAAHAGARVLLWDLDPQGAATFFFRVKPGFKGGAERLVAKRGELARHVKESDVTGLHLLPADFSLRNLDLELDAAKHATDRLRRLLEPLDDDYDVAFVDCAPGISLTSEAVFGAADVLAVPTIPTTLSVRTLTQLQGFLGRARRPAAGAAVRVDARPAQADAPRADGVAARPRPTVPADGDSQRQHRRADGRATPPRGGVLTNGGRRARLPRPLARPRPPPLVTTASRFPQSENRARTLDFAPQNRARASGRSR